MRLSSPRSGGRRPKGRRANGHRSAPADQGSGPSGGPPGSDLPHRAGPARAQRAPEIGILHQGAQGGRQGDGIGGRYEQSGVTEHVGGGAQRRADHRDAHAHGLERRQAQGLRRHARRDGDGPAADIGKRIRPEAQRIGRGGRGRGRRHVVAAHPRTTRRGERGAQKLQGRGASRERRANASRSTSWPFHGVSAAAHPMMGSASVDLFDPAGTGYGVPAAMTTTGNPMALTGPAATSETATAQRTDRRDRRATATRSDRDRTSWTIHTRESESSRRARGEPEEAVHHDDVGPAPGAAYGRHGPRRTAHRAASPPLPSYRRARSAPGSGMTTPPAEECSRRPDPAAQRGTRPVPAQRPLDEPVQHDLRARSQTGMGDNEQPHGADRLTPTGGVDEVGR